MRYRRALLILGAGCVSAAGGAAVANISPLLIVGGIVSAAFSISIFLKPPIGLFVYTCLYLIRPGELYPELAPLRIEFIVGSLTIVSFFAQQIASQRHVAIDWSLQTRLLLSFLLAVLLSVPFAVWRSYALDNFATMVKAAVFYFLVVQLVESRRLFRWFVYLFSSLIGYIGLTAFSNYLQGNLKVAQGIDRALGQTDAGGDPNHLGATMASAVPLFLLLAAHKSLGWRRVLFLAGVVVLVATMAVTGSRSSLLGFLGGVIYLWWKSKHKITVAILGVAVLLAGYSFVLPNQYKDRYASISSREIDGSSRGRLEAWKAGMEMLSNQPLFGAGIGCFVTAYALNRGVHLESHSLYVQVPAETGLLGAVTYFLFIFVCLRTNRRTAKVLVTDKGWEFEKVVLDAIFAGTVVLLVSGVFGHSLLRRTWYIYGGLSLVVERLYMLHGENRVD